MELQLHFFNIWAVLVGFVSNMVIGALWYSPILFGNTWLKLSGRKAEDISKEEGNKAMALSMIPAIVMIVLMAILLGLLNVSTIAGALIVGCLVSVGFIGMTGLNQVFFEDKSLALVVLNVGYSVVALNVAAVILTLWK